MKNVLQGFALHVFVAYTSTNKDKNQLTFSTDFLYYFREVTYNKEVSTTAYPAVNQQEVLEVISNTDSASFGALK